jgi:hypothetical protein
MNSDDAPKEKVQGVYRAGGKTVRFTLTQLEG